MAEGGEEFGRDNPYFDHDDDDDDEQEVNRTQPFQPVASSTPNNGGQQMDMKTMQHEQSGLPETSYEETPLLGRELHGMSWDDVTKSFPNARYIDLESSYGKDGKVRIKIRGDGKKKDYQLFTKKKGTQEMHLNPLLTKEIKEALGPMAQELIDQQNESVRTERQSLRDSEKELKEAEMQASKKEKTCRIFSKKKREFRPRLMLFKMSRGQMLKLKQNLEG